MKKPWGMLIVVCLLLIPFLALGEAASVETETAEMRVTSQSINEEGRLLTVTAANRSPNKPRGENKSPQITFDEVEGATCYALVMFDTTANWLHFLVADVTETELTLGAYANTKQYIGPYPPRGTGDHNYRLEVFALKAVPDKVVGKMNAQNTYDKIVQGLDVTGGEPGNILLRGFVDGLYAYGDKTEAENPVP